MAAPISALELDLQRTLSELVMKHSGNGDYFIITSFRIDSQKLTDVMFNANVPPHTIVPILEASCRFAHKANEHGQEFTWKADEFGKSTDN
jgi:hypothetical protein